VMSSDGQSIGHCVDAMAGCTSGRLSYLAVGEGGVAGVGESLRRLPWSICSVEGEQVLANIRQSEFRSLNPLEPEHWPAR